MDMQVEKATELAEYLGIRVEEIELSKEYENNSLYKTPKGDFTVMTEDEADYEHKEYIRNFIAEVGVEGFSAEFRREILSECVDQDGLEDYLNESIAYEVENMTDDEVVEKAEEFDLAWADEYRECEENDEVEKCAELISDNRGDLVDLMVDDAKQTYNGIITDWIIDNLGEEELNCHLNNYSYLLDIDAISDRCLEVDGYGNNLAGWDGKTNSTDNFYVFKQNYGDNRSLEFLQKLEKQSKTQTTVDR